MQEKKGKTAKRIRSKEKKDREELDPGKRKERQTKESY
jgi:hypothetical protein